MLMIGILMFNEMPHLDPLGEHLMLDAPAVSVLGYQKDRACLLPSSRKLLRMRAAGLT
jgi:hypothetical protein